MIAPVEIPGFSFTKQSYADLVTRFRSISGYTEETLGTSFLGSSIYGYMLNGGTGKPLIFIQGNIHGSHEWRTCYWVSEFMKLISNPSLSPDPATFQRLKDNFAFYFLPSANPDGYGTPTALGPYQNGNLVNLNRNFGYLWENGPSDPSNVQYRGPSAFSEPESQIVRDKVLALKPTAYVSCHSWGGQSGLTVLPPSTVDYAQQVRDVLQATIDVLGLGANSYPLPATNQGLDANWVGQQYTAAGSKTFAMTMESGDQSPEVEQARMGMTGLLAFCLMVEERSNPGPKSRRKRRDLFSSQYLYLV